MRVCSVIIDAKVANPIACRAVAAPRRNNAIETTTPKITLAADATAQKGRNQGAQPSPCHIADQRQESSTSTPSLKMAPPCRRRPAINCRRPRRGRSEGEIAQRQPASAGRVIVGGPRTGRVGPDIKNRSRVRRRRIMDDWCRLNDRAVALDGDVAGIAGRTSGPSTSCRNIVQV